MRRGAHRLAAHLRHHDLGADVVEDPLERQEVAHGPLDAPLLRPSVARDVGAVDVA